MFLPVTLPSSKQRSDDDDAALILLSGQLIERAGGLRGMVELLRGQGLGEIAQSWVEPGANAPVVPAELVQALWGGGLGASVDWFARHLGMDEQEFATALAWALPFVIDELTPGGQLPHGAGIDVQALQALPARWAERPR